MAFLEVAGKPLGAKGIISSMRPKRYYTIPRDSVEKLFNEFHDLSNFFLLEFQRVVYVEDIFATGVVSILLPLISPRYLTNVVTQAFGATFTGYFLIKYIPLWALLLLSK